MPPKSLIKLLQAYARSLGNALRMVDDILARMPKDGTTSTPLLKKPEDAQVAAMAKFEKMDANYVTQQEELADDLEPAHTKAYEEAVQGYRVIHKDPISLF